MVSQHSKNGETPQFAHIFMIFMIQPPFFMTKSLGILITFGERDPDSDGWEV